MGRPVQKSSGRHRRSPGGCGAADAPGGAHRHRRRMSGMVWGAMALPAVIVCALWIRSYWAADRLMWRADDGVWGIRATRGDLVVAVDVYKRSGQPVTDYGFFYDRLDPEPADNDAGGMYALNVNSGDTFAHGN